MHHLMAVRVHLAIENVLCENITANASDAISITFYATESISASTAQAILHPPGYQGTHNSDTTENLTWYTTENQSTHNSAGTETVDIHNLDTNTAAYIISIGSLATILIVSVLVPTTVILIVLKRIKAKVRQLLSTQIVQKRRFAMNQCMRMSLDLYVQSVPLLHRIMLPTVIHKNIKTETTTALMDTNYERTESSL